MRRFLVENDFATQKQVADAKRHELEELLFKHYASAKESVEQSWCWSLRFITQIGI